ncbi:MAG: alpha/beta fold hydrolase [Betaproteobacteria bacterium]
MSTLPALRVHRSADFRLASGAVLPELVQSHVTLGKLDASGANAVLVLHGLTTGPAMLSPGTFAAEGAWCDLVGPGRAIDTERWFIVCPNALGSSYGTTGPGSIDERTGRPWGTSFPAITVGDMVAAQKRLLDSYGVMRLVAAVGPSMGGYQAFEWGVTHPGFVQRVVAAVSAPFHDARVASSAALLAQLSAEPAWRDGGYADTPGSLQPFMARVRKATLARYGIAAELAARLPDPARREAELQRLAHEWAAAFDPAALLALTRAMDRFDVRPRLAAMRGVPLLYVLSRSDAAFPPSLAPESMTLFAAAGIPVQYLELASDMGHLASGADAHLWSAQLARFLQAPA